MSALVFWTTTVPKDVTTQEVVMNASVMMGFCWSLMDTTVQVNYPGVQSMKEVRMEAL